MQNLPLPLKAKIDLVSGSLGPRFRQTSVITAHTMSPWSNPE